MSTQTAIDEALVAALKALHVADVAGGISMADLRSIAIQKCREAVAKADAGTMPCDCHGIEVLCEECGGSGRVPISDIEQAS